jgi:hypothetical protein
MTRKFLLTYLVCFLVIGAAGLIIIGLATGLTFSAALATDGRPPGYTPPTMYVAEGLAAIWDVYIKPVQLIVELKMGHAASGMEGLGVLIFSPFVAPAIWAVPASIAIFYLRKRKRSRAVTGT